MTPEWEITEGHLVWTARAEVVPDGKGGAVVTVTARNALAGEIRVTVAADWKPGQEASDVECWAVGMLGLVYQRLAATLLDRARQLLDPTEPKRPPDVSGPG
jgi:hypothetical protein